MKTNQTITRVNFTFALTGGMWIERENGNREWMSFESLENEVGKPASDRLYEIAYANGMCGMWYNAENGKNVYADGVEVN